MVSSKADLMAGIIALLPHKIAVLLLLSTMLLEIKSYSRLLHIIAFSSALPLGMDQNCSKSGALKVPYKCSSFPVLNPTRNYNFWPCNSFSSLTMDFDKFGSFGIWSSFLRFLLWDASRSFPRRLENSKMHLYYHWGINNCYPSNISLWWAWWPLKRHDKTLLSWNFAVIN